MTYRHLALLFCMLTGLSVSAQRVAQIFCNDGVCLTVPTEVIDSLRMSTDGQRVRFVISGTAHELDAAAVDSVTFGTGQSEVCVTYTAHGPRVVNPYAFRGVDATMQDGVVRVINNRSDELTYRLSGSGVGGFKLYSSKKQTLVLDNLNLTAKNGAAINIQSKKKTTIELPAGTKNSLTDVAVYTMEGEEDQKATLFAEGQLVFQGEGDLEVQGLYKHAVCSDDYLSIEGGNITVSQAVGDGLHTNDYFQMTAGRVTVSGTQGDCIDGGEGYVKIGGGYLNLTASAADTKALKCDSVMSISGGEMEVTLKGEQTKGLKSGRTMSLTGGRLHFTCSGGVVVTDGDPSYCSAIKSDGHILVDGAYIDIVHSGTAGKGLSADSTLTVISGEVNITLSGAGGTFTNASNTSDKYTATGLKADGDMHLLGGTLTLS
ncbi:MAG: carbohydrate-binding domain-containing protein, partial [Bacteroidaceae bacterium]|nr:carbohydrate-binding domain-containing protein [Bacteroidaceae bacterium]